MMLRLVITGVMSFTLLAACQFHGLYSQSPKFQSARLSQPIASAFTCTIEHQTRLTVASKDVVIHSYRSVPTAKSDSECDQALAQSLGTETKRTYSFYEEQDSVRFTSSFTLLAQELTKQASMFPTLDSESSASDTEAFADWVQTLPISFSELDDMKQYAVSRWQKTHDDLVNDIYTKLVLQSEHFTLETFVGDALKVRECSVDGVLWQTCDNNTQSPTKS